MTPLKTREQAAREILAAHLKHGSATHRAVLCGPPYPANSVTIGQAIAAIIAAQDAEREMCAGIAESFDHGEPIQRGEAERYGTARAIASRIRKPEEESS